MRYAGTRAILDSLIRQRGNAVQLALALCCLAGCSTIQSVPQEIQDLSSSPMSYLGLGPTDPKVKAAVDAGQVITSGEYRIGAEDMLEISVWKEEALKKEILVRPDGGISFPLAGDLKAAGLTPDQLREQLTERIEKYIPDAVVSVIVLKAANYKVYVLGRVNKPGDFTSGRPIDVLQALSMAGGLTPFASENKIRVVRKLGDEEFAIPFDYGRAQRGKDLEKNITLKSGDVVVVP